MPLQPPLADTAAAHSGGAARAPSVWLTSWMAFHPLDRRASPVKGWTMVVDPTSPSAADRASPLDVTILLRRWSDGDERALNRLMPLVYEELRRVAHRRLAGERSGHTLQTTALVHEAYARMADADLRLEDRAHFFALAARTMRRILVDYARARLTEKRGGGAEAVTLDRVSVKLADKGEPAEILALHEALEALERQDSRKAQVVEAHIFGGLTYEETAEALGISPATVARDLQMAKAWLARELG